jgi:hypothetical protein
LSKVVKLLNPSGGQTYQLRTQRPSAATRLARKVPLEVPRSEGGIKVDGILEEDAWATALIIPLRFETRPRENVSPTVETLGFIT